MSSSLGGRGVPFGHCSCGRCGNSGPFILLPLSSVTLISRDRSSATLSSPSMCLHWLGSVSLWISPILDDTKGLKLRDRLCIQARVIVLSVKKYTFPN